MSSTTGKVAIVTGSSRGIGAELVVRLARDGFKVVLNYSGNAEAANNILAAIKAAGGDGIAAQADVSDPTAVKAMFDAAESAFGGIDVVINCAGILTLAKIEDFDDATFDKAMAVNVKGTFNACREAAKRVRKGGRIINFSTSVIGVRLPTYGVYAATKGAVEALTSVLAQEMRGREVSVNAVAPGPVATELFLHGKSPELIDHMAKLNPLERLGQTNDIANVVSFLSGPEGAWINGQTIRANGGMC
ncbi:3-oxoacyl-[acyl-carrier protein] reductase [Luteibacter sp. UNCMF331Sha3.1]|uniref:SDR family oxidoreductase n=1 Tax=Luteibacter sp. UNCMF331Sha3.1 TaxID=1502760 RepID=UPI0008B95A70|nr:SDR family oxidoreductase [Luteibacter sp. UNCMF331Sha3.1]SEM54112.1 3-oxoacyl-[acyl-carrier protein] reductase [Luteibacter sp. UNCMF331Sha3.1]